MRLSEAVSPARTIPVPFVNATLQVEYRPMSYTPEELDAMQAKALEAKDAKAGVDSMIDSMLNLLVGWDLTDDEDNPIPVTREGLRKVPLNVYTAITQAVAKDQAAGGEGTGPSVAG